ncbi:MAG: hypothetical protein JO219_12190 [Candidatus Eremiobacteraeota bacterium]|nr:hypothetical protein [Candidatus Eremiobacteraeota bacterium]
MLTRWQRTFAFLFVVCAIIGPAAGASACVVTQGEHLVLASQGLDPDVFVWDSAQRLVEYLAGNYNTETVLHHTMLATPGTKAVVVGCKDGAGKTQYSSTNLDLVGVKLTDGPNKGRYGWVVADDTRTPDGKPITQATP